MARRVNAGRRVASEGGADPVARTMALDVVNAWKAAEFGPQTMREHHRQQETYLLGLLADRVGGYEEAAALVQLVYGEEEQGPDSRTAHRRTAFERNEMARNLKPGDLVDVENLYYYWGTEEPPEGHISEYEYGVVDTVVDNGNGEVTIYFENMEEWVLPYEGNTIVATASRRTANEGRDTVVTEDGQEVGVGDRI